MGKQEQSALDGQFASLLSREEQAIASLIARSMDSGLSLELDYDGESRIVEPHAMGISTKGTPVFRGYQVTGGSQSGEFTGWKLFSLAKVRQLPKLLDIAASAPREGYQRDDKGMLHVLKQL